MRNFRINTDWEMRALCPGCGWSADAPLGKVSYCVPIRLSAGCPKCGTGCRQVAGFGPEWEVKKMRDYVEYGHILWIFPVEVGRGSEVYSDESK